MFNSDEHNFSFISITNTSISRNGVSLGLNTFYSNIDGQENKFASLTLANNNLPFFNNNKFRLMNDYDNINNNIDNETFNYKKNTRQLFRELENNQKQDLEDIRNLNNNKIKLLKEQKDDKYDKLIENRRKQLQELEEDEDDIDSTTNLEDSFYLKGINKINDYKKEEINKIDKEIYFNKPKLEIEDDDNEIINNYKNKIKSLNKFSNHPNYNKIMKQFNLDDYV
mgnify:CR=1 FL=1